MSDAKSSSGVQGPVVACRDLCKIYMQGKVEVPVLMPLPWGKDRMAVTVATMEAAAQA